MKKNSIIISFAVLMFLSFFYLAFTENRQADLDYQKDWWILSFQDPTGQDVNFTIENHSNQSNFHWEILRGSEKLEEKDVEILKGESVVIDSVSAENLQGKIIVKVSDSVNKKEIYKNF